LSGAGEDQRVIARNRAVNTGDSQDVIAVGVSVFDGFIVQPDAQLIALNQRLPQGYSEMKRLDEWDGDNPLSDIRQFKE